MTHTPSVKAQAIIFLLLVMVFHGQSLISYAWSSTGLLALNRALATPQSELAYQTTFRIEDVLRRATTFSSENHSAWRGLGFILMIQGHEDEAMTAWKQADLLVDELVAWGRVSETEGHWNDALQWYMRAAVLSPESSVPWYHVAQIYEQQEVWEQALAAYQEATVRNTWGALSVESGDVYTRMAMIYYGRLKPPRFDQALAVSDVAIQEDSFYSSWSESHIHYLRGRILWQDGLWEEAYKEFQTAVQVHEEHTEAHYWLGIAHYVVANDATQAEMEMKTVLALRPNNKWPYIFLGKIYSETDRREEAIEIYQQALTIDPNDKAVQERLAELTAER